jgi:K+-sensing histidine kinase KdpD
MRDTDSIEPVNLEFPDVLACSFHDIKNSLELLSITLDSLCESLPEYPLKNEHLGCVQYEVLRISNTLTYMLAVYKMENRQFLLDTNHNSVHELLEEAACKYGLFTRTLGISLEVCCPEDLIWYFDRNLISIILDETLNNASRYARDKVKISATSTASQMTLSIEDNGPGYPEPFLSTFMKNTSKMKKIHFNRNRTGLGIYFAKIIAESHTDKSGNGGKIHLSNDSSLGGSKFSIILPA